MTKYCLIPGAIENTLIIVDCKDLGVWSMPYRMIKAVIGTVQMAYKARSRAVFCLNAPSSFSAVWNVVKYVLDEITTSKVQISSTNTCELLQEIVHPDQLEEKFGGNQPDRSETGNYWPPNFPNENFGFDESRIEQNGPSTHEGGVASTGSEEKEFPGLEVREEEND